VHFLVYDGTKIIHFSLRLLDTSEMFLSFVLHFVLQVFTIRRHAFFFFYRSHNWIVHFTHLPIFLYPFCMHKIRRQFVYDKNQALTHHLIFDYYYLPLHFSFLFFCQSHPLGVLWFILFQFLYHHGDWLSSSFLRGCIVFVTLGSPPM